MSKNFEYTDRIVLETSYDCDEEFNLCMYENSLSGRCIYCVEVFCGKELVEEFTYRELYEARGHFETY